MAVVQDPQIAFSQVSGVVQLGVGPTTVSLVNLGVIGTQVSGPILLSIPAQTRTFSIQQPDGSDGQMRVGETFSVTNTVTNTSSGAIVGRPTTLGPFTVIGSGTVTPLLGTPANVILASNTNGQQFFFYPNNDPNLLGVVSITYDIDTVGYDFSAQPPAPLCFARSTMIDTSDGLCAIEDLKSGMLVRTKDCGLQEVRWIGSRVISAAELTQHENLRPIRISAGALGKQTPSADLIVSPQHRLLVRSKIALKMFDAMEVLVAAKQLLQLDGIDYCHNSDGVEYFHILFDRHEIVFANGAETESLFTGPESIKSVDLAALEEIYQILPELRAPGYSPKGARVLTSGRMARRLVSRHIQHGRELV